MSRYLDPKADVVFKKTPGELNLYESYWDQVSREKTLIMDKYAEGLAEGEARGIEKIAINMLRANKSVSEIILYTGLSEQAIAQLQKKIE